MSEQSPQIDDDVSDKPQVQVHIHNESALAHTNVLAVVAICVVWFCFPAALVCGHLALSQIRESGERGRTAAIVALVVGYIELACVVFFIIMYFVYMGSTGWTDV